MALLKLFRSYVLVFLIVRFVTRSVIQKRLFRSKEKWAICKSNRQSLSPPFCSLSCWVIPSSFHPPLIPTYMAQKNFQPLLLILWAAKISCRRSAMTNSKNIGPQKCKNISQWKSCHLRSSWYTVLVHSWHAVGIRLAYGWHTVQICWRTVGVRLAYVNHFAS